ncbi:MAG TPA: NUDIX hydrolase [Polyangiaceae bacterium]
MRPPCALRPSSPEAPPEAPQADPNLWEVPAGLVEPGEDPAETAARELGEELGFTAQASDMRSLGPWSYPAPGFIGERHLFYAVEVDPSARQAPSEDGSALEREAAICALPLLEVIEHCRTGGIRDAKTELVARRLVEALSVRAPRIPRTQAQP